MNEVRMEHTEGLGKLAEVWIDGALLTVCDGVSLPGQRCTPGILEDVELRYYNDEGYTWEDALRGNPSHRSIIEPVRGWGYIGFGQVEQIMPVVINFGGLRMEDPAWSTDDTLIGQFVRVPINRLEIVPKRKPDWPDEMK